MVEMVFYSLSSLKAVTIPKKSTFQKLGTCFWREKLFTCYSCFTNEIEFSKSEYGQVSCCRLHHKQNNMVKNHTKKCVIRVSYKCRIQSCSPQKYLENYAPLKKYLSRILYYLLSCFIFHEWQQVDWKLMQKTQGLSCKYSSPKFYNFLASCMWETYK